MPLQFCFINFTGCSHQVLPCCNAAFCFHFWSVHSFCQKCGIIHRITFIILILQFHFMKQGWKILQRWICHIPVFLVFYLFFCIFSKPADKWQFPIIVSSSMQNIQFFVQFCIQRTVPDITICRDDRFSRMCYFSKTRCHNIDQFIILIRMVFVKINLSGATAIFCSRCFCVIFQR